MIDEGKEISVKRRGNRVFVGNQVTIVTTCPTVDDAKKMAEAFRSWKIETFLGLVVPACAGPDERYGIMQAGVHLIARQLNSLDPLQGANFLRHALNAGGLAPFVHVFSQEHTNLNEIFEKVPKDTTTEQYDAALIKFFTALGIKVVSKEGKLFAVENDEEDTS